MKDYETFRSRVLAEYKSRRREDGRRWTYKELAKAASEFSKKGVYTANTIEAFMCGSKITDEVAIAIAKALDIPEHLAT